VCSSAVVALNDYCCSERECESVRERAYVRACVCVCVCMREFESLLWAQALVLRRMTIAAAWDSVKL